ncbi:MAG TPA: T9SS type A sorting domain-containing protein [Ignavibacteriales bacterium]|nr:T9SS type A sorting domain-containing protein [Ignavibacteriales bacterium]
MIKRLLFLGAFLFALSATSYSQWTKQGIFPPAPDTLKGNSGGHGVAVDPDGKVWIAPYRPIKTDSVLVPDSNKYFNARPVYVFTPDGKPASFSPIKLIQTAEKKNKVLEWSKTGMAVDNNGNILVNDFDELVRINYKTGEGMNWIGLTVSGGSSLCKPAVDSAGNIYVSYTLGGNPIVRLNPDFTVDQNVVDTLTDIGRTTDVTPNGNVILAHRFTAKTTYWYERANAFEGYTLRTTVLNGMSVESSNYNPVNRLLYVSAGSYNGKGTTFPNTQVGVWYGFDNKFEKPLDSLAWTFQTAKSTSEEPRGIAFTPDGKTAYVTAFGAGTYSIVQKLTATTLPTDVQKDAAAVTNYSLSQNYPNPFNPSTEIRFSIAKAGFVSLKVYDMLGKEVATLMNSDMPKGNYSVRVDGKNLTSGIYIYQLISNGVVLNRKMTLLK